jgi:spermidine/putrescine transport system substrate-binding protein
MRGIAGFCALIGGLFVFLSSVQAQNPLDPWECPDGYRGETLHIYNWSTYIAENTIPTFEMLCGVTVNYSLFDSNDALMERMRTGRARYDIIVPSDYVVSALIDESLIQPLDFGHIPNFIHIREDLKNPPYDPDNLYTVPYQTGAVILAYNRAAVGEEITSWRQMFEYDGPVAWLEHDRAMLSTALLMLDEDPNSTDPEAIAAARDYLIEHSENVIDIPGDDGQFFLEGGQADIIMEYSGDIAQLIASCNCDDYEIVIPDEGASIMIDVLAIPARAPNKALAEVFIDYILHPVVSAEISNEILYASPNDTAVALALIDPRQLRNPGIYPPASVRARMYYLDTVGEAEALYAEAWEAVKDTIFERIG